MKNILLAGLMIILVLSGCKKVNDDLALGKRPDERLNEILNQYSKDLTTGAPNGWKAYLFPKAGFGFGYYFTFDEKNRVKMYSDWNAATATQAFESSYRIKATQRPSLFFDTYSYIHILSDPDPSVGGGVAGAGYNSDFEFGFDSTKADVIYLTGNQNKTPLYIVKATKAEADAYKAGGLNAFMDEINNYLQKNTFLYLDIDGKKIATSLVPDARSFSLAYEEGGSLKTTSSEFAFSLNSIFLKKPLTYGGVTFREVFWDAAKKELYILSGNTRIPVKAGTTPIFPMHLMLGVSFTGISVPGAPLEGWSDGFKAEFQQAARNLQASFSIALLQMNFDFDTELKTMTLQMIIRQGTTNFQALYYYGYTKTQDGIFKFKQNAAPNGNGGVIATAVNPILKHIDAERFKLEYLLSQTGTLGQFISQDNPAIKFSGTMK
ncbi:DUF4302 domain-containing protein [Chitinophaga sp. MD30]|uniref:DUF4302 domain-containing protein n=1 Tax=Chitinophaga sp. MD30 TaxID=2033437 RepID=UPI000BAF655E|nr:DUF4302 domain-containing protein [Chitinophaga sp. MD30]ASZ13399.1 hypothetical protein CK934_21755 [Chitinophaga sp. MD30]